MNEVFRIGKTASEMHITVQGYKVTLCFAEKANLEVAAFVKRALLGACSMSSKQTAEQLGTPKQKNYFPKIINFPGYSGRGVR